MAKRTKTQPKTKASSNNNALKKSILQTLGSLVGGAAGGAPGALIGSTAASLISKVTGWGDYKVKRNSIAMGNSVPTFSRRGDGVRIAHREFIKDIVGSELFDLTAYHINPGLNTTFPWLSKIASRFEEYEMHGLLFEYRPSSGSAISSSSAALGTVIMATDYNSENADFIYKQQMESYEFSNATVPSKEALHAVECAPGSNVTNTNYIRSGSVPQGKSPQLYDMGVFQVATQGMQSAYTVGELWVTYDVSLKKPRINVDDIGYAAHCVSSPVGTAAATAPFGTSGLVKTDGSNIVGLTFNSDDSLLLEMPGVYLICASWFTSGSDITANAGVVIGSNLSLPVKINNDTVTAVGTYVTAAANYYFLVQVHYRGLTTANEITFNGLTGLASGNADVWITQLPYNLA
jgi:hypothetical protein